MSCPTIRQMAPKPSDAVRAMIDGLLEIPGETFQINMNSWGHGDVVKGICFGCAATCTIHQLFHKTPDPERIGSTQKRALHIGLLDAPVREVWNEPINETLTDLDMFECAIDSLRKGRIYGLLHYYGMTEAPLPENLKANYHYTTPPLFQLLDANYKEQIPLVEELYQQLVAAGL